MHRPDFLIVGAPKCGTTALADWLGQHPRVFMQVHIVLFDDLRADSTAVYRRAVHFLGLQADSAVRLRPRNVSKVVRWRRLQRLILAPPWPLSRAMPTLRRAPTMHRLRAIALSLNSRERPRPPMEPALRHRLTGEMRPSVERLETLIERDLSAWR